MSRRRSLPTELELLLLKVLWQDSPLPVREIREQLEHLGRDVAHTSVITTLNIMVDKKVVSRSQRKNAFWFSPDVTEEEVSAGVISDVMTRVFDGSARDLMLAVLDSSDVDDAELNEIRKLINQRSRRKKEM
jgi:BlaI family penicillinase repressor